MKRKMHTLERHRSSDHQPKGCRSLTRTDVVSTRRPISTTC